VARGDASACVLLVGWNIIAGHSTAIAGFGPTVSVQDERCSQAGVSAFFFFLSFFLMGWSEFAIGRSLPGEKEKEDVIQPWSHALNNEIYI